MTENEFASDDFLADFLEEADEHCLILNQHLLALEKDLIAGQKHGTEHGYENKNLIEELFRSYHTLKGLCGMIGLSPGADLSHAMESILRALQQGEQHLTPALIDSLLQGNAALEAVIGTLRDPAAPVPLINPILDQLGSFKINQVLEPKAPLPPPGAEASQVNPEVKYSSVFTSPLSYPPGLPPEIIAALNESDWQQIQASCRSGRRLSIALFVPSAEKIAQGFSVNYIRERLTSVAHILKAIPLMKDETFYFAFILVYDLPFNHNDFPPMDWYDLPGLNQEENAVALNQPPVQGEPAPATIATPTTQVTANVPASFVRVEIGRLDELMRLIGDLVVSRSRLAEVLPYLSGAPTPILKSLGDISSNIERQLRDLREGVMRVRLVPLAEVFQRMPLAVRDAARPSGKEVRLLMEGTETEIDKILVERLLDPLLHLVRNAIAHGIGTPQERIAVGKPPEGTITLRGHPEGDHVVISIEDDGRGVDFDKIAAQARSLGWLAEDHSLNPDEILEIICRSGFSTKAEADLGAGRGVGMDVVLRSVNALGGRLDWQTNLGIGTTFFLRLPLTMVIIDAFIISAGGEQFAVPRNAVNTVIEIDPDQIVQVEKGELIAHYQSSLPLLRLADLFNLGGSNIAKTLGSGRNILYGLVNGQETGQTALIVDKVMGLREVVVRPISDPLVAHPGIAGATELGDGRVILILDLPDLIRFAKQRQKKLKTLGK